jgi:microcystin-dependent protein
MAQPYVGEIRMFAGSFAPAGWEFCSGQPMPISENETLFQLIGTTYGGDGESTFNLPNLQSRVALHMGSGSGSTYQIGESAGTEQETLTIQQIPNHTHTPLGSSDTGAQRGGQGSVMGRTPAEAYASEFTPQQLSPQSIGVQGGSQPHTNMQPYLCINYIISMFGIFPSPT